MKLKQRFPSISIIIIIALCLFSAAFFYRGFFGNYVTLQPTSFNRLPGWQQDDQRPAFAAFLQSCTVILKLNPNDSFSTMPKSGKNQDWQTICRAAQQLKQPDQATTKQFFETWFQPYHVGKNYNHKGLYTGYYLPFIHGSLQPSATYNQPIYALPDNLVKVDLGAFRKDLIGRSIVGEYNNHQLTPYPDRAAIMQGAIGQHAKVLLWCNSAVDVFFAQVQGSAIVILPDHTQRVINYAGDNGRPYRAIGELLYARKEITESPVSMQAIRAWLKQHPDQVTAVLNYDPSYVFFRLLPGKDPLGTPQIPLTPGRSLAIDNNYIGFGTPIWLSTTVTHDMPDKTLQPMQQLMIAQDTGGAIKGIIRGDVYFGGGENAAFKAGYMHHAGEYWALLPKVKQE